MGAGGPRRDPEQEPILPSVGPAASPAPIGEDPPGTSSPWELDPPGNQFSPGDGDPVSALLDRVIQRIFTAGLMLQLASDNGCVVRGTEPAVVELTSALDDIHSTALSWASRLEITEGRRKRNELGAAIDHHNTASGALGRMVAQTTRGDDGCRLAAINDSDRLVRSAIITLSETVSPFRVHPPDG